MRFTNKKNRVIKHSLVSTQLKQFFYLDSATHRKLFQRHLRLKDPWEKKAVSSPSNSKQNQLSRKQEQIRDS
jgi:hypothetical protein